MTDFDPLGELLKQAQEANPELQAYATRELMCLAADHLADSGAISDIRLRYWLVDYLGSHIKSMPLHNTGRPGNSDEQLEIAIRVERARLPAADDDPPGMVCGMLLPEAIEHVIENCRFTKTTVRQYHEKLRRRAVVLLERHGKRLPARN
jgi:hypothetical protein